MRAESGIWSLMLAALSATAAAQTAPGPENASAGRIDIESMRRDVDNVNVDLPDPTADLADSSGFANLPGINIADVSIEGNTVLDAAEIDSITNPYRGRFVTIEELHALRQALTRRYVELGYVSSGVIIPDQNVSNGVVTMQVIEGRLIGVEINGNSALRTRHLDSRVRAEISTPLNIRELQSSLRLLQEEPLITSINAQLLPGERRGESQLKLAINERSPWHLDLGFDNYRPPSVGEARGVLTAAHESLTGRGDILSARLGLTEGVEDHSLTYSIPLTVRDARIEAYFSSADSEIVESPFQSLDIDSNVESWGIAFSYPLIRQPNRRLTTRLGFENKRSTSTLLNLPFSFSPGDINGRAEGSSTYLSVDLMQRFGDNAIALRGTLNVGLNVLNPTENPGQLPDSTFTQFVGQAQFIRNVAWRNSRLIVRSSFQWANEPLLAIYKFAVGGRYSVRGYRENVFVRDNGMTASVEFQFPLFVTTAGQDRYNLRLAPFIDWGQSKNEQTGLFVSGSDSIVGAGLGLLWQPTGNLSTEIYWGKDFDDQNISTETWQDRGFHARIAYVADF